MNGIILKRAAPKTEPTKDYEYRKKGNRPLLRDPPSPETDHSYRGPTKRSQPLRVAALYYITNAKIQPKSVCISN